MVRRLLLRVGLSFAVGLGVVFLALPVVALVWRIPPARLLARLADPIVLGALWLSLLTALGATLAVVLLGLPLAWLLASRNFRGKRLVEVLVDLPMVLPPTVAGLALLLAFGRTGLAGGALAVFGVRLPFTTLGVVVAQAFMAAPFFIGSARAGFASVDPRLLDAASTLRASEAFRFFRVTLPLALPSLVAGGVMACARALGEFGATITFAGNLPRVTQTMPIAVYVALQSDLEAAITLAVLLVILSLALLLGLRGAVGRLFWSGTLAARQRP